jgi:hypothetical protein
MVMIDLGDEKKSSGFISVTQLSSARSRTRAMTQILNTFAHFRIPELALGSFCAPQRGLLPFCYLHTADVTDCYLLVATRNSNPTQMCQVPLRRLGLSQQQIP